MLARRSNIKTLAEIELERKSRAAKPPSTVFYKPARYVPINREQRAERNGKIRDLWLTNHSMREIEEITGINQATVAGVIVKLGLQGMGGKCKKFIKRRYKTPTIQETA